MKQNNRQAKKSPLADFACHVGPNLLDENVTFNFSESKLLHFIYSRNRMTASYFPKWILFI